MQHLRAYVVLLLMVVSEQAFACSCAGPRPPEDAFKESGFTFVGQVERIRDRFHVFRKAWTFFLTVIGRDPIATSDEYERLYGYEVTFAVERVWRGPADRAAKVVTGRGGGDCGYGFEVGKRYLVYAYQAGHGEWGTGICSRTRKLENAAEDLTFLQRLPILPLKP